MPTDDLAQLGVMTSADALMTMIVFCGTVFEVLNFASHAEDEISYLNLNLIWDKSRKWVNLRFIPQTLLS